MADYRLDCCGGFPSHTPDCDALPRIRQAERERERQKRDERAAWKSFFLGMTEQEVFEYVQKAQAEVDKAQKWRIRRDKGLEYLRDSGLASKYLDWRRY